MGKVSVKGVLVGGTVDVVTSMLLGIPFALYARTTLNLSHIPRGQVGIAVAAVIRGSAPLYIGELLTGLTCSALGGYVAAWLAGHDELLNGALSAFLCVSQGIYSLASGKDSHPLLLQVLMFVSSPALGLLGGYLRLKQTRAQIQQPQPRQ